MGYRFLVPDGGAPHLRFICGEVGPIARDWRSLGLDAVNDNDPDGQARMEQAGQSALGGGPE